MTHYNFKDIAGHIHTLPIRAVSIKSTALDKSLHFYKLENESSYKFEPITSLRTNGEVITLGYNIEVNLYIQHNDFTRLYSGVTIQNLLYLFESKRVRCQIALGNQSSWDIRDSSVTLGSGVLQAFNSTKGMILDTGEKLTFTSTIESVEMRPRLIIKMTGVARHIANLSSISEAGNTYLFN
jgi:hypothetical protein